jgi:hypothetical protein
VRRDRYACGYSDVGFAVPSTDFMRDSGAESTPAGG